MACPMDTSLLLIDWKIEKKCIDFRRHQWLEIILESINHADLWVDFL